MGIRRRLAPLLAERPAQDRASELAAAVDAGHARHLLRRRDRDGRQLLSRRPRRRAHADAMVGRPQCRVQPRQPAALCTCRRSRIRSTATRRSTSRRSRPRPRRCLNWMKRMIGGPPAPRPLRPRRDRAAVPAQPQGAGIPAPPRRSRSCCASPTSRARRRRPRSTCRPIRGRVPIELTGQSPFPPVGELPYLLTLPAYGFYWFLLAEEEEAPAWHTPYTADAARLHHADHAGRNPVRAR